MLFWKFCPQAMKTPNMVHHLDQAILSHCAPQKQ